MLSLKIKDLKNRNLFLKNEKKNVIKQFLFIHFLCKPSIKKKQLYFLYLLLQKNKYSKFKYKTKTKVVRRCLISNRGRSNFRPYGVSRFILRNLMQYGILPGYKKAV